MVQNRSNFLDDSEEKMLLRKTFLTIYRKTSHAYFQFEWESADLRLELSLNCEYFSRLYYSKGWRVSKLTSLFKATEDEDNLNKDKR